MFDSEAYGAYDWSPREIFHYFAHGCLMRASYTDPCANVVVTPFPQIYNSTHAVSWNNLTTAAIAETPSYTPSELYTTWRNDGGVLDGCNAGDGADPATAYAQLEAATSIAPLYLSLQHELGGGCSQ